MGTPINRRQALAGIGGVSLGALLAACDADDPETTTPITEVETTTGTTTTVETRGGRDLASLFDDTSSCTLTPEQTEGPFYFDADAIRSDIREDRDGTTLRIAVRVRDAQTCEATRNAVVDIWHCDAGGSYSGFSSGATGARFLRGAQVTDHDGIVEFTTVYPGWYMGRTVHVHAKVHLDSATALTTQLYFDDDLTAAVYENEPYASRTGRDTFNGDDTIFDAMLVMDLSEDGAGYLGLASFDVASA
jgi:protocatechuate 3,4-dioxygenase beta subunit